MSDRPSDEQQRLAEELAEQLARLRVEDVIVNTLMTVSAIGFRNLAPAAEGGAEPDLEQARLAVETMRALTPLLDPLVPPELLRDLNATVASLQLGYAQAVSQKKPAEGEDGNATAG